MTKTNSMHILALISASLLFATSTMAQEFNEDPNFFFVGNSYTSGLRDTFRRIIENEVPEWADTINAENVNPGGHTLGGHMQSMETGSNGNGLKLADLIINDPVPWQWLILQDQSQVPGYYNWNWEGTEYWRSTQAAIKFNNYMEDLGGRVMFFMTWGRMRPNANDDHYPNFLTMQDHLEKGYQWYRKNSTENGQPSYIAPAGLVFKTIYNDEVNAGRDPLAEDSLFRALYRGDGSHPSGKGTYVTALTIYTSMYGKNPQDIRWFPTWIVDEETDAIVKNAVSRTILETFKNGEIDYPWTEAFPAGASPPTQPPTTSSPTTATPTTASPTTATPTTAGPTTATPTTAGPTTAAPTPENPTTLTPTTSPPSTQAPVVVTQPPAPGNSNRGSITVIFQYDEYPEEISWVLVEEGSPNPVYYQPYESNIAPNATVIKTIDNLKPNGKYMFKVSDQASDGICCQYGEGKIGIYDDTLPGKPVLFLQGEFQSYFEIQLAFSGDSLRIGTWEDMGVVMAPVTEGWPGPMPTQPRSSLSINVLTDDHPEDLSWNLYFKGDGWAFGRPWEVIKSWDGSAAPAGALASTDLSNLSQGWYKLVVNDSQQNGVCCSHGNGYISVNGPISRANGELGMVWGNPGQFLEEEAVLFRIKPGGTVTHVGWRFIHTLDSLDD